MTMTLQSPARMEVQVIQIHYHWGIIRELVPSVSKLYLKKNISTVKRNGQPITGASDFIWKEWAVRKFVLLKTK